MTDRAAGVVIAFCGVASLAFMMMVGRRQKSIVLMAMFTVWVAAPFIAMLYGLMTNAAWLPRRRVRFNVVALPVSLASTAIYAAVSLGPAVSKPAQFFLLVPAMSWLLIAVFTLAAKSGAK